MTKKGPFEGDADIEAELDAWDDMFDSLHSADPGAENTESLAPSSPSPSAAGEDDEPEISVSGGELIDDEPEISVGGRELVEPEDDEPELSLSTSDTTSPFEPQLGVELERSGPSVVDADPPAEVSETPFSDPDQEEGVEYPIAPSVEEVGIAPAYSGLADDAVITSAAGPPEMLDDDFELGHTSGFGAALEMEAEPAEPTEESFFELGAAGGKAELREAVAAPDVELGASGYSDATQESALAAANAFFAEEPPAASVTLDDEFYDDIEIGEQSGDSPAAPDEESQPLRTAHIIRREAKTPKPTPVRVEPERFDDVGNEEVTRVSVIPVSPDAVASQPDEVVMEAGEPDDEALGLDQALDSLFGRGPAPSDVTEVDRPRAPSVGDSFELPPPEGVVEALAESPATPTATLEIELPPPKRGDEVDLLAEEIAASRKPISRVATVVPEGQVDDIAMTPVVGIDDDDLVAEDTADSAAPPAPSPEAIAAAVDAALDDEEDDEDEVIGLTTQPAPAAEAELPAEPPVAEPAAALSPSALDEPDEFDESIQLQTSIRVAALAEADVAPELPPSPFADVSLALELDALDLPESVEPDLGDRTEDQAGALLLYERELTLLDEPGAVGRMRLEAGRLAESLGDYDRARTHYADALEVDARLTPALRALRRVERQLGDFAEVLRHLESEIAQASAMERRGLAAYRADVLAALGERERAMEAVAALLDEAPTDVRALLLQLELAYADNDGELATATLQQLATSLADAELSASLALAGAYAKRTGDADPTPHLESAMLRAPKRLAPRLAALGMHRSTGDWKAAALVLAQALSECELAERDTSLAGALAFRKSLYLALAEDADGAWEALAEAGALLPYDYLVQEALAEALAERGSAEQAGEVLLQAANIAPTKVARAFVLRRAATCLSEAAPEDFERAQANTTQAIEALQSSLSVDTGSERAAFALAQLLESTADVDALCNLERTRWTAEDGGDVHGVIRLSQRLLAAGRYDEAAGELVKARANAGDSPVLTRATERALAYAQRFDERAKLLEEAAETETAHFEPSVILARAARAAEDLVNHRLLVDANADEGDERADARNAAILEVLEGGMRAWERVLEVESTMTGAHAAVISLAERHTYRSGNTDELIGALTRAREAAEEEARVVQLGLRHAALLLGKGTDDAVGDAEAVLDDLTQASPADPRVALAKLLQTVAGEDWDETADVLLERAEGLGESSAADALRYRAASILLDKAEEGGRAADVVTPLIERIPNFTAAADLVRAAHRQMGGTSILPPSLTTEGQAPVDVRRDFGDRYAQLIREAEVLEYRVGDPERAFDVYQKAIEARPGDPIAELGIERVAMSAGRYGELAEAALRRIEMATDRPGKALAYGQLARIDGELRADPDAALMSWEAALRADPTSFEALRAAELAYSSAGDEEKLRGIYDKLLEVLSGDDAAWLALERARLGRRLGKPDAEVLADYQRAHDHNAQSRRALFALESAQAGAITERRLQLELAVASYFHGDERARAAFLTRAGETAHALGDLETALQHYRAAHEALPDYAPALTGWRYSALAGELWQDFAEAASLEAQVAPGTDERVVLDHLAGVALMDKALDGERSADAFRRVLALDPRHRDAFARLRILYDEQALHDDLAALIEARLEVESESSAQVSLHHALADLYRSLYDDRDRAEEHLRKVLELDKDNLKAVAGVSDIAWEKGEWAQAAEALIHRARLEKAPGTLKHIFFRLGTIYTDFLPDPEVALKSFEKVLTYDPDERDALDKVAELAVRIEDWKLALGASEKLIKIEKQPEPKVRYLLRVARVYRDGYQDRSRAEQALRIALDIDPTNVGALRSMLEFFESESDKRGLRVNLDRVAASMRSRLSGQPLDGLAFRVLSRVFEAREGAGAKGSLAIAGAAAEVAVLLGAGEEDEKRLAGAVSRPKATKLAGVELDEILFPRAVSPALRAVFRVLGERVAKHVGVDLRRYGVSKGDRLGAGDPAAAVIHEMARELRVPEIEVYVSKSQPTLAVAEPNGGGAISLVLGAGLVTPDRRAELRFLAARCLKLAHSHLAVPARMPARGFGLLVAAIVRHYQPDFSVRGLDNDAVAAEMAQQKRLFSGAIRDELAPFAVGLAGRAFDYQRAWAGISEAGGRAGIVLSGSSAASLSVLLKMGGYRDIHQAALDTNIANLLRFIVSEEHVALRAALDK